MEMQDSLMIKKGGRREGAKPINVKTKDKSMPICLPPKLLSQSVDDTSERTPCI
jgi:hypothetical protein